jgi:hypothetical protein
MIEYMLLALILGRLNQNGNTLERVLSTFWFMLAGLAAIVVIVEKVNS